MWCAQCWRRRSVCYSGLFTSLVVTTISFIMCMSLWCCVSERSWFFCSGLLISFDDLLLFLFCLGLCFWSASICLLTWSSLICSFDLPLFLFCLGLSFWSASICLLIWSSLICPFDLPLFLFCPPLCSRLVSYLLQSDGLEDTFLKGFVSRVSVAADFNNSVA
jgi:hypothetical protein